MLSAILAQSLMIANLPYWHLHGEGGINKCVYFEEHNGNEKRLSH